MKEHNPRIHCKDGVSLSVQASSYHYCTPREDDGPYSHVEVGYVEKGKERFHVPDEWKQYADSPEEGSLSDVFGYIPMQLVESFIIEHGGIDSGHLP